MNSLMKKTLKLKDIDRKSSYQIAKEISLITLNITWYPDQLLDSARRIESLVDHIRLTFKNSAVANELCTDLAELAADIYAYDEINSA